MISKTPAANYSRVISLLMFGAFVQLNGLIMVVGLRLHSAPEPKNERVQIEGTWKPRLVIPSTCYTITECVHTLVAKWDGAPSFVGVKSQVMSNDFMDSCLWNSATFSCHFANEMMWFQRRTLKTFTIHCDDCQFIREARLLQSLLNSLSFFKLLDDIR